nr:hypothetical protein [Tanacetum cinerariifolium]
MDCLQVMMSLRNSNQDPPVDLYYSECSGEGETEINSLTKEPFDTFSMVDEEIEVIPFKDIDDLVPIPRVPE